MSSTNFSQREVADLLGIDRTRMVALVDELEAKGWVKRRPQPDDRRKNIVTLTRTGRGLLQRGSRIIDDCEQQFLAALSALDAEQLKNALGRGDRNRAIAHRRRAGVSVRPTCAGGSSPAAIFLRPPGRIVTARSTSTRRIV